MQTAKIAVALMTTTGKITSAFIVLSLAAMTGCSTPSAIPETYDLPTILDLQIPLVQQAILKYVQEHDDRLPATSVGEQLAIRAVTERSRSIDEMDAAGDKITLTEFIDSGSYIFRPAKDEFILSAAGRIVRVQQETIQSYTWFAYHGRYSLNGNIIDEKTSYLENADLFVDAMRSADGQSQNDWNYSAWAIGRIYVAVTNAEGKAAADKMVDQFVKEAIATGLARVPNGMTPRQAAFGGVRGNPSTKSALSPPAPK
jgi:hypothetical protein